jgi:sulfur carrier protein
MTILLNGQSRELPAPGTPAVALAEQGLDPSVRGVAVAVDGEVVPRSQWAARSLPDGARVEVLTAMQGG